MHSKRLPDGTWVTASYYAESSTPPSQCPGDACAWEDMGPPSPPGLLLVPLQLQTCPRCGWVRGKYLKTPFWIIDEEETG